MTTITLPLPPSELRANARTGRHWGKLNAVKNAYKLEVHAALDGYRWGEDNNQYPVQLTATVYLSKRMRADASDVGYWIKAAVDCLVEAGIFKDDDNRHINPFVGVVAYGESRLEVSW